MCIIYSIPMMPITFCDLIKILQMSTRSGLLVSSARLRNISDGVS
jgi:hypothetical protein